ncbi:hypothetical protein [Bacillus sp. X1(2014)]|uniref:hypothetical protein n=1 Tax=Bacillus sp. X1(2014) TaxID=1565991 RepID=UPI0016431B0D|nr:hypothetical protein [Bacillus sp. X1(2014)]
MTSILASITGALPLGPTGHSLLALGHDRNGTHAFHIELRSNHSKRRKKYTG